MNWWEEIISLPPMGGFLGQQGDGVNVRVATPDNWNTIFNGEDSNKYGGESNEHITLNGNSDLFTQSNTNMFDIISVITHEYEHSYNPNLEDTPEEELKALVAQKKHYSYQYLSHEMKEDINYNIQCYLKIVKDRFSPQE